MNSINDQYSNVYELQMHQACAGGNVTKIEELIERGVDIKYSIPGLSCLKTACINGQIDAAKCLLSHGANPNSHYILSCSAYEGYPEIVKLLIDYGAKMDAEPGVNILEAITRWCTTFFKQDSLYYYKTLFKYIEIINILLQNGVSVAGVRDKDMTFLHQWGVPIFKYIYPPGYSEVVTKSLCI